jgi:hypothetical protein
MPRSSFECSDSLLFHGGDTGSTPVRDARLLSILKTSFCLHVLAKPLRILSESMRQCAGEKTNSLPGFILN